MSKETSPEEHRLYMLHDAWRKIMDPEETAGVKTLYILGYNWALVQMDLGTEALSAERFEEVMQGSHIYFGASLARYLKRLPNE